MIPRLFCFFRDSAARREMLTHGGDASLRSYLFSGADELRDAGWQVDINLSQSPTSFAHHLGVWTSSALFRFGGYGGDFATCFQNLRRANRADVVWSTVDTTGIPLSLLRSRGLLRRPLLYTSIGLPERLRSLREGRVKRAQIRALNACERMMCYGWEEAIHLREILGRDVEFVPYGVDTKRWLPLDLPKTVDVLSLGADPMRDFAQLLPFAAANPTRSVRIISTVEQLSAMGKVPANVQLSTPVPLANIAAEMARARVIALPVRENTYSGATTTLLQAMSMGLPVVVSDVGAIRGGYGFTEENSCVRVAPGNASAFAAALENLLDHPAAAEELGIRARAHVCRDLDWDRYLARVRTLSQSLLNT
jgi:glycosyltransferase involved in cell wall biosynthesis